MGVLNKQSLLNTQLLFLNASSHENEVQVRKSHLSATATQNSWPSGPHGGLEPPQTRLHTQQPLATSLHCALLPGSLLCTVPRAQGENTGKRRLLREASAPGSFSECMNLTLTGPRELSRSLAQPAHFLLPKCSSLSLFLTYCLGLPSPLRACLSALWPTVGLCATPEQLWDPHPGPKLPLLASLGQDKRREGWS